jgi:hypothetical protein
MYCMGDTIISFPIPDEERARRLKIEVAGAAAHGRVDALRLDRNPCCEIRRRWRHVQAHGRAAIKEVKKTRQAEQIEQRRSRIAPSAHRTEREKREAFASIVELPSANARGAARGTGEAARRGRYPATARATAVRFSRQPELGEEIRLLGALREMFVAQAEVTSAEVVAHLTADPASEWYAFHDRGPITQRQVAFLLRGAGRAAPDQAEDSVAARL